MRKKILLTGATGFLGSHLLESFVHQGFEVTILKRSTSDTWRINHLLDKTIIFNIDETDLKVILKKTGTDIIVHTACSYGRKKESLLDVVNTNLILGLNLLDEAIKNNVKTFINTDTLLPSNINDYSLSKAQFSDWLHKRSDKIQVVNFRIEQMYGVNDDAKKFIPWLINEMINGIDDISLTSGIQKRDFIYISDIVAAYNIVIKQSKKMASLNVFDLGTNVFTEVREFVMTLAMSLEKTQKKEIVSRLKFGAIPYRDGDIMLPQLDNNKLIILGWQQKISITQGIEIILKQYK